MQVVRMVNPKALEIAEVADFMREAVRGSMFMGGDFDKAALEFAYALLNPRFGVFLGEEDGLKALAVFDLPSNNILPYPIALHAFNKGSKALARAVGKAGIEFLKEHGYTEVLAHNGTGRSDAVWQRTFRHVGKSELLGSMAKVSFE